MQAFAAVKFIGSTVGPRVIRLQRSWVLKGRETTAGEVASLTTLLSSTKAP